MDRVGDLDISEEDRDKLMDGFDSKMRALDNLIKNEAKKQDSSLEDKLAARRARKKALAMEVDLRVRDKEQ